MPCFFSFAHFQSNKQQHNNNFQPNIAIKTTSLVSQVPIRPFTSLWRHKTNNDFLLNMRVLGVKNHPFPKKKKKNLSKIKRKSSTPQLKNTGCLRQIPFPYLKAPTRCFLLRPPALEAIKNTGSGPNVSHFPGTQPVTEQGLSRSRPILRPPPVFFIALVPKQGLSSSSACHGAGLS